MRTCILDVLVKRIVHRARICRNVTGFWANRCALSRLDCRRELL